MKNLIKNEMNLFLVVLTLATLTFGLFAAGCIQTDSNSNKNSKNPTSAQNEQKIVKTVIIKEFAFSPQELIIKSGDTVRWENQDSVSHSIVINELTNSKILQKGEKFEYTFPDKVGEYSYICSIHPAMKGKVIVE